MTDDRTDEEKRLDSLDIAVRGKIIDADMLLRILRAELHGWGPGIYPGGDVIARRLLAHYARLQVAIDLAGDLVSRDPGMVQ